MFFSKLFVSAVALFGAATSVIASPIAEPQPVNELVARGYTPTDVYNSCKKAHDSCQPYISKLTPHAVTADVVVAVDAIASIFADVTVDLQAYVAADVDISADVSVILDINVQLFVALLGAISTCGAISATVLAQINVFIHAYLAVLAQLNASICASIGLALPLTVQLFVALKLNLVAGILVILNIGISL